MPKIIEYALRFSILWTREKQLQMVNFHKMSMSITSHTCSYFYLPSLLICYPHSLARMISSEEEKKMDEYNGN
jgi:hypothetical protein